MSAGMAGRVCVCGLRSLREKSGPMRLTIDPEAVDPSLCYIIFALCRADPTQWHGASLPPVVGNVDTCGYTTLGSLLLKVYQYLFIVFCCVHNLHTPTSDLRPPTSDFRS